MATSIPATMRAWQYTTATPDLISNLKLKAHVPVPTPSPGQHLVKILAVGLNPVDYKPAESPWFSALTIKKPATPGADFTGILVTPAAGTTLKSGQLVFGVAKNPFAGGMLKEYSIAEKNAITTLPANLTPAEGATVCIAGVTEYQCIKDRVQKGERIFINGGSGGAGTFGIQIAKAMGLDCTVTCSSRNVELCRSLGADEVIDYTQSNVVEALKKHAEKKPYSLIVDNAFSDSNIFYRAHEYTTPKARYVNIAVTPTLGFMWETIKMQFLPSVLGGGRRKAEGLFGQIVPEDLEQVRTWLAEGKIKPVIDSRYSFEQVPEAFRRLKAGRVAGKVIVEVAELSK